MHLTFTGAVCLVHSIGTPQTAVGALTWGLSNLGQST